MLSTWLQCCVPCRTENPPRAQRQTTPRLENMNRSPSSPTSTELTPTPSSTFPSQPPLIQMTELESALEHSVAAWRQQGVLSVWLPARLEHLAWLAPLAAAQGFVFHHAKGDLAMLLKWIGPGANRVPPYATHQVGKVPDTLSTHGHFSQPPTPNNSLTPSAT